MVYVLSNEKKPLMPCGMAIARILLKQGKAKEEINNSKGIIVTDKTYGKPYYRYDFIPIA